MPPFSGNVHINSFPIAASSQSIRLSAEWPVSGLWEGDAQDPCIFQCIHLMDTGIFLDNTLGRLQPPHVLILGTAPIQLQLIEIHLIRAAEELA